MDKLIKYILEGLAVAIAAHYIPAYSLGMQEIAMIALSAAAAFFILDTFVPEIGIGARTGAGFGIGAKQVKWGGIAAAGTPMKAGKEGMEVANGINEAVDNGQAVPMPKQYVDEYLGEHDAIPNSVHCRGSNCYTKNAKSGYASEYLGEHSANPNSIHCRGSNCYTKNALL